MGLPDSAVQATELVSRLIIIVRMAQMSLNMLMTGTPIGLAMGIASLTLTMFAASDFGQSMGG
jgi:hypothetical protein